MSNKMKKIQEPLTMETGRGQRLQKVEQREDISMQEDHCVLCGSELLLTHVSNFVRNFVEERACCPDCGVKNKTKTYTLQ